jgi:hypothetical protein
MADKALISELTWRSLKMQKDAFPDMPHYIAPDDIATLLRPSTRKDTLRIHVVSLAIMADKEKDFRELLKLIKRRKANIVTIEEGFTSVGNESHLVEQWRLARRKGAAKRGGEAKSKNSEQKFWDGFTKIADRWHLKDTSKVLMKEAGIKHHDTVRVNLGYTRWEWRKLSDAKRARVLKGKCSV